MYFSGDISVLIYLMWLRFTGHEDWQKVAETQHFGSEIIWKDNVWYNRRILQQ
jgi:hypothetical protein